MRRKLEILCIDRVHDSGTWLMTFLQKWPTFLIISETSYETRKIEIR